MKEVKNCFKIFNKLNFPRPHRTSRTSSTKNSSKNAKTFNFSNLPKTAWVFVAFFGIFSFFYVQKFVQFATNAKYFSTAEDLSICKSVQLNDGNDKASFEIEPRNNIWQGITLFYDVLDSENYADIALIIQNQNGETVYSHRASQNDFDKTKNYYRFSFGNAINAQNEKFTLNVYGTNIALKCNAQNATPVYKLYGNILKKFLVPAVFAFYFAILACLIFVLYFIYVKNLKIQTVFLIAGLIFGLFFMFVMPPLTIPDECRHFDASYAMSNYILGIKNENGKITKRVCDTLLVPSDYMQNENWTKFNYYEEIWPHALKAMKNKDFSLTQAYSYAGIGSNYPFLYLPSSLGLTLGRLLKLNCVFTFLLGRFFNLAFFILVMFFTLKKYQQNNTFFASIALFPMFLHQIASFSYDSVLLTLALYLIIAFSSLITQKRKLETKEIILFFIATIAFAPSKAVYFPILFLVFLFKKEQFGQIGKIKNFKFINGKVLFIIGIFICIFAGFAIDKAYSKMGYFFAPYTNTQIEQFETFSKVAKSLAPINENNTHAQIGSFKWIFSNSIKFFYMVLFSFVEKGTYYFETYFGAFLGWEAIPMNKILVYSLAGLLIFQFLHKKKSQIKTLKANAQIEKVADPKIAQPAQAETAELSTELTERTFIERIVPVCLFIFIVFSIFVSFSISNPVNLLHPVLGAIQGRYFLPIMPLLFLSKRFVSKPSENLDEYSKNIFAFQFLILILFSFDLIYRIVGIF